MKKSKIGGQTKKSVLLREFDLSKEIKIDENIYDLGFNKCNNLIFVATKFNGVLSFCIKSGTKVAYFMPDVRTELWYLNLENSVCVLPPISTEVGFTAGKFIFPLFA